MIVTLQLGPHLSYKGTTAISYSASRSKLSASVTPRRFSSGPSSAVQQELTSDFSTKSQSGETEGNLSLFYFFHTHTRQDDVHKDVSNNRGTCHTKGERGPPSSDEYHPFIASRKEPGVASLGYRKEGDTMLSRRDENPVFAWQHAASNGSYSTRRTPSVYLVSPPRVHGCCNKGLQRGPSSSFTLEQSILGHPGEVSFEHEYEAANCPLILMFFFALVTRISHLIQIKIASSQLV